MTSAFSRIEASKSAARARVSDAFKNEAGAFDLPSILVGVVVVGVLTAGVLASIFGVIPFAQDKGAEQNLGALTTAQGVYKAQGSEGPTSATSDDIAPGTRFANTLDELKGDELIGQDVAADKVLVEGSIDNFYAVTKSDSGKYYGVSKAKSTPVELKDTDSVTAGDQAPADLPAALTYLKTLV